jgi:hypothetical protein
LDDDAQDDEELRHPESSLQDGPLQVGLQASSQPPEAASIIRTTTAIVVVVKHPAPAYFT